MTEAFRYQGYVEREVPRGQDPMWEPAVTVGQWGGGRGVGNGFGGFSRQLRSFGTEWKVNIFLLKHGLREML